MTRINLSVKAIEKVSSAIEDLDFALLDRYLPELENRIVKVSSMIENTEIKYELRNISGNLYTTQQDLRRNLTKLENFLEDQVKNYNTKVNETYDEIMNILKQMQDFTQEIFHN